MAIVYGNSVQEFYLRAFRENFRKRKERINSLKTKQDALNYIAEVREKIKTIFQFPAEKCPLNPRFTGEISFPGGKMKKLLFESRKHYTVSASLAFPDKIQEKNPAVLFLCGHSELGRMAEPYQTAIRQFAARGFVVLGLDPVGQGERKQFQEKLRYGCCDEHNILGKQMLLTGEWFGSWRTYDGIRGIDYLDFAFVCHLRRRRHLRSELCSPDGPRRCIRSLRRLALRLRLERNGSCGRQESGKLLLRDRDAARHRLHARRPHVLRRSPDDHLLRS